jgi:hypothetical protein
MGENKGMNNESAKLFVRASRSFIKANPEIFAPKPQRPARTPLVNPASGKTQSGNRYCVSFTIFRIRPLDEDNAFGSVKSCVDLLVGSGLLPSDSPETLKIEVEQAKVAHRKDQRTEITITWPS